MSEKMVMVGFVPEVAALEAEDQLVWFSNGGNLKIEFDAQRCPFSSNVFQAPAGVRLPSGPPRRGVRPGAYRYRVSLNDVVLGHAEVLIREK